MRILDTHDDHLHDPPFEILDGATVAYHEAPLRARVIRTALAEAGFARPELPPSLDLQALVGVHTADYIDYLANAYEHWIAAGLPAAAVMPSAMAPRGVSGAPFHPTAAAAHYAFDLSAPICAATWPIACNAAAAALHGAELLLAGERSLYALCRPPGHHATSEQAGGFCYLNNAAIAAHRLSQHHEGSPWALRSAAVAVLDIDYHHGNGTQAIFYERNDVLVVSLHADPRGEYPFFCGHADERGRGIGEGYNLNLPLAAGCDDPAFLAALHEALESIAAYSPRYLVVSAGLDTFAGDPLGGFRLSAAAYPQIGAQIAALGLPTLFVQEGGYAVAELGTNLVGLLSGFANAH